MEFQLTIGEKFVAWASSQPGVRAIVQIGSRVRGSDGVGAADSGSDWDFQLVVDDPSLFELRPAIEEALQARAIAYTVRTAILVTIKKLSAVFPTGTLDVLLMPTRDVEGVKAAVESGKYLESQSAMTALVAMSSVLLGGYRFLKGADNYKALYEFTASSIPPARINDSAVLILAEGVVCDYLAPVRLINRGELTAGQRWLHMYLVEVVVKLLHEVRLRRGQKSFPDGRRLEHLEKDEWTGRVALIEGDNADSLLKAVEHVRKIFEELIVALLDKKWAWPKSQ